MLLRKMRIFNRVQPIHKPVTGFGAEPLILSRRPRARRGVPCPRLMGIDAKSWREHGLRFVKIAHYPRPARDLESDDVETAALGCPSSVARRGFNSLSRGGNLCRPWLDSSSFRLRFPGTSVPGFRVSPLRDWRERASVSSLGPKIHFRDLN